MQDMSQLQGASVNARAGSRATADDVRVMVAAGRGSTVVPATIGKGSGSPLPPVSDPHAAEQRQRIEAQSRQHVQEAIADINRYVQSIQRDLKFSIDESSGESVVQVIDRSTQEVVRQIPSDVALRLARNLKLQQLQQQARYASESGAARSTAGGLALIDTRI